MGEVNSFLNVLYKFCLMQHVDQPTRDSNILDLIISSDADLVKDMVVGKIFRNSDH